MFHASGKLALSTSFMPSGSPAAKAVPVKSAKAAASGASAIVWRGVRGVIGVSSQMR
jgi:hypothetical protein